jgi:para-nitrobenzyl esterase
MGLVAETRYGKLEGIDAGGAIAFKGIPYAAPPVGARRWAPPERPAAWSGVRRAAAFSPVAPQTQAPIRLLEAFFLEEPQSEDCLCLNVWTPAADGARRPVLVWIHGGAFAIGSGSQSLYDGAPLARRGDVVVVTINYRLGALGFLHLRELTGGRIPATGNEGILDQVAALEWVRENIAGFGGDPANVTIFGESAGGMSVGTLLGLPRARGLCAKAIPQSGAAQTVSSLERAVRLAERLLGELGIRRDDVDALRAATPQQLLEATARVNGVPGALVDPEFGMTWKPVLDGRVLAKTPIEEIRAGSAAGVAVMAGSTLEEWKLLATGEPGVMALAESALLERTRASLGGADPAGLVAAYRGARTARGEAATPFELHMAIETDRIFRMPALRLLEAQARHDPRTYAYLFTWPSPMMGGMLGSCHALELGFVFGTHATPGMRDFCGAGPGADALAESMQDAWLAFAKSGDPSCPAVGRWTPHRDGERATLVFGEKRALELDPRAEERRAWDAAPASAIGSL